MESKVYANKDWQHIGKVPEAGRLYADGNWCFNTRERTARTCTSSGYGALTTNYYIMHIRKGDQNYPYSGHNQNDARVGQLIVRVGERGLPEALETHNEFEGGEDLWMRINDGNGPDDLADNDGYLTLRFVSAADSAETKDRMKPTNSYGHPIGTQYTRDSNGAYWRDNSR
jgi:hypothetical protein